MIGIKEVSYDSVTNLTTYIIEARLHGSRWGNQFTINNSTEQVVENLDPYFMELLDVVEDDYKSYVHMIETIHNRVFSPSVILKILLGKRQVDWMRRIGRIEIEERTK